MMVRLRYGSWLPRVFGSSAVTLYPFIFFTGSQQEAVKSRVMHHEFVHVRQVRSLGWLRFYWRYVVEYVVHRCTGKSHLDAYFALSFERQAYDEQSALELTESELKEIG